MRRIKRLILKTKIKIVLVVLYMILGSILWTKLDISIYKDYAKESLETSTIAFDVLAENGYLLNVLDKKEDVDLEKLTLKVYNETYMNNYYQLAVKINKTCDYSKLNAFINDKQYNLSDILIKEDERFYYFIVGENNLTDKIDIYEISFFIDIRDLEEFQEKDLNISFVDLSQEII